MAFLHRLAFPLSASASIANLSSRAMTKSATFLNNQKRGTPEENDEAVRKIFSGILKSQTSRLAEAITLVESAHPAKRRQGQKIVSAVAVHLKKQKKAEPFRIGLTGPPGAGKSTFIEMFGKYLTSNDRRLAVLAVDPSSSTTGGSLLGDRTRMPELSRDPNAYIRPSPSSGALGGVTESTSEAILLCEAAGYDVILVETVGVGQSEFIVSDMVDFFVLIIPPASGDELQGLKRGVVELVDLVLVNKADGDLLSAARRMKAEYTSALKLLRKRSPVWHPQVMMVSSLDQKYANQVWKVAVDFKTKMEESGQLQVRRGNQQKACLWNFIRNQIMTKFRNHPDIHCHIHEYERLVESGEMTPSVAAGQLLDLFVRTF